MTAARALIAEDEPLLAQVLVAELRRAWPELVVAAQVGDGVSAVNTALAERPDILFLDIRMPGQTGLEAAAELADRWPDEVPERPFPLLVFVTAYDEYAVAAFEAQALDYLLKPVTPERLERTVRRLQAVLAQRVGPQGPGAISGSDPSMPGEPFDALLERLRHLLEPRATAAAVSGTDDRAGVSRRGHAAPLTVLQASVGNSLHMVPITEVVYFEAADKYVRVLTREREYLIRTPLKELLAQLDESTWWQVHRSTLVRADAIESAVRDETGRVTLKLRHRSERLHVSRVFAGRFKAH